MCGKDEKALNVLSRINGSSQAKVILADIKATTEEKTEKLFTYGWMVIFIGIMLSVFQQAVGINAVLYFAPRIFETMGMANPMVQTVLMGVVNILFTLLAVFTVEKWGRKPLLISGYRYGNRGFRCSSLQHSDRPSCYHIGHQHYDLQRFIYV